MQFQQGARVYVRGATVTTAQQARGVIAGTGGNTWSGTITTTPPSAGNNGSGVVNPRPPMATMAESQQQPQSQQRSQRGQSPTRQEQGVVLSTSTPIKGCSATSEVDALSTTTRPETNGELLQIKLGVAEALDALPKLSEENMTLKASFDKLSACCGSSLQSLEASVEALDRSIASEMDARLELERGFGKDLRDFVKSEMEHAREMMVREMRERLDGQKVVREEVQLQQQALSSFTGRVDEAIIELRTELPRLCQENAALKAALQDISEKHAPQVARLEGLERELALERDERCATSKHLSMEFQEHLAHVTQCTGSQIGELRRQVEELGSRADSSCASLAREFREHMATEVDRVVSQLADVRKLHNELRLRSDVSQNLLSKDLRDYMAVEVERVTMLVTELRRLLDEQGARCDEAQKALSMDLREHLALESKELREMVMLDREQKEKEVVELRRLNAELGSRTEASHGAFSKDLREYVGLEAERMMAQIAEVKRPLDELGLRTDATEAAVKVVQEQAEQLSHGLTDSRSSISGLEHASREAHAQGTQQAHDLLTRLAEVDKAVRECIDMSVKDSSSELHRWIDAAIVGRVNSLDRGLRTEMSERSSAIQQVVAKVSHNAERWCQLQAKVDEFLVEIHKASKPCLQTGVGQTRTDQQGDSR